jgi:Ca2+/Na+ antiporter
VLLVLVLVLLVLVLLVLLVVVVVLLLVVVVLLLVLLLQWPCEPEQRRRGGAARVHADSRGELVQHNHPGKNMRIISY